MKDWAVTIPESLFLRLSLLKEAIKMKDMETGLRCISAMGSPTSRYDRPVD